MIKTILSGHVSPETAYVVEDYPYGFTLRCKIRYWLESSPNKGVRFVSQTTNPKRGDTWNKPKASTYCRFGGAMFLDEKNHVHWQGVTEYDSTQNLIDFKNTYGPGIPAEFKPVFESWLEKKIQFNNLKATEVVSIQVGNDALTVCQPEILQNI